MTAGLALALAVGAQAASATVWHVNSTADPGSGCSAGNCTLRAAIASAASGDTVDVPAGHYLLTAGVIIIPNAITVLGAGAGQVTIDANMASQVFSVPVGGALNLNRVTVTGGSQPQGFGGDIYNRGTLLLDQSTVSNGTAQEGGDIYTEQGQTPGASLVLTGSTISGGSAGSLGGGIYVGLGATGTIMNSTVSGNTVAAGGGQGGGIFTAGTTSITGTTITANTVGTGGYGGGISDSGSLAVANSTVTGNTVTSGGTGGGIYGVGDVHTISVANATIDANSSSAGANLYFFTPSFPTPPPPPRSTPLSGAMGRPVNTAQPSLTAPGFENTIVADASGGGSNCASNDQMPASNGHNLEDDTGASTSIGTCGFSTATHDLVGVNPELGPLADNGGPTQTMALVANSPAVDAGATITAISTDQRGFPRPQPPGGAFDIGAYEQGALVDLGISMTGSPNPVTVGKQLTYTLTVKNDGPTSDPASGVSVTESVPADVKLMSVESSQGACAPSAGSIDCHLGSLNRPDVATVTVTVIPQAVGTTQSAGEVSGDGHDPTTANNGASVSVQVDDRPAVRADRAQGVSFEEATLRGRVNPNNAATTYFFQFGRTTDYGSQTAATGIGAGTSAVVVSNVLHGLSPGTVYHFRVVAKNAVGQAFSRDRTFRTPQLASLHVTPPKITAGERVDVYGNAGACPVGSTLTLFSPAFPFTHKYNGQGAVYTTVKTGGDFSIFVQIPSSRTGGPYPVSGLCGKLGG